MMADRDCGAAWRRRQRQLRMHWRHEQLTLQMAPAAAFHHSRDVGPESHLDLRSQKTVRARREERDAASTVYFRMDEWEMLAAGSRPPALLKPRSQLGLQRHTEVGYKLAVALEVPCCK